MARTSLIILFFIFSISLFCQSPELKTQTITEYLTTRDFNKGKVKIFQDARLDSLMSKQKIAAQNNLEINGDVVYVSDRGYRIQIFSGNNQRESKNEAYQKEKELNSVLPDFDTYVTFNPPFWRLRVGNYRTSEEAHAALRELKKSFPRWKEMFIVRDVVKYPMNYKLDD